MDPVRLHLFLTLAVNACRLPPILAGLLFASALRQCQARWPLASCVVHCSSGPPSMVAIGRS